LYPLSQLSSPTSPSYPRPSLLSSNMADTRINAVAALRPIRNVVSASWLYPFKGIYYFCTHRAYYPLFGRHLIPLTVTSIVVLGLLFTFTYLPQVAFLAIFHGHLAWFNAAFLVLGEGQALVAMLFEAFLVDETLVNVFDVRLSPFISPLHSSPSLILQTVTNRMFTPTGNSYQRRSNLPRLSVPSPFPRCSECRKDAWQADRKRSLQPLFLPPNCRIHPLPPSKLNPPRGYSRISGPHRRASRALTSLEIFQAEGSNQEGTERRDPDEKVEIYLVWDDRAAVAAGARPKHVLFTDDGNGVSPVGC